MIKCTIHSENNLDWFQPSFIQWWVVIRKFHSGGKWNCQLQLFTRAEPAGDITCWCINDSSRLFARERTELLIELWEVFGGHALYFSLERVGAGMLKTRDELIEIREEKKQLSEETKIQVWIFRLLLVYCCICITFIIPVYRMVPL